MSTFLISHANLEKAVEKLYRCYTKQIMKVLGSGVTYTSQLLDIGKHLFGTKYKGTFSSDTLPKLTKTKPYAITNVDTKDKSGSHWVACCYTPKGMLMYDSFGRHTKTLMKNVYNKYKTIDADHDKEQKASEKNCGSRCIAFLMICDNLGPEFAKLI